MGLNIVSFTPFASNSLGIHEFVSGVLVVSVGELVIPLLRTKISLFVMISGKKKMKHKVYHVRDNFFLSIRRSRRRSDGTRRIIVRSFLLPNIRRRAVSWYERERERGGDENVVTQDVVAFVVVVVAQCLVATLALVRPVCRIRFAAKINSNEPNE